MTLPTGSGSSSRPCCPRQPHASTGFEPLLEPGAVRRPGRGCGPSAWWATRRTAAGRGIWYTIPRRRDECRTGPFDRAVYRLRNRVERLRNHCKQCRRLATRYDKRDSYRALWVLAATILWLHP